jgi:hypothetical protein
MAGMRWCMAPAAAGPGCTTPMLAPLRPVLRGAAAWEGWWVVALLLCAGATSAQQQQQQDVDEHASRYCADSPRWSIAGGGANCSVAARLIQSYLRSASRPKCHLRMLSTLLGRPLPRQPLRGARRIHDPSSRI